MPESDQDWPIKIMRSDSEFLRKVGIKPCVLNDPFPKHPSPQELEGPEIPHLTEHDDQWLSSCGAAWEPEPEPGFRPLGELPGILGQVSPQNQGDRRGDSQRPDDRAAGGAHLRRLFAGSDSGFRAGVETGRRLGQDVCQQPAPKAGDMQVGLFPCARQALRPGDSHDPLPPANSGLRQCS